MSESASLEGTAAPTTTAGTLLREAREAAGLHVASLAATLKVPVAKLEALEQDRYDLLPDAVFVRALASSVCRTLRMDPQPVLALLPRNAPARLVQDTEHINAPFRTAHDGPAPRWFDQVSRPVLVTVVLLLLGALVLVFLPYVQKAVDRVSQIYHPAVGTPADPVMPPPGAAATVPATMAPVDVASAPPADAASNALPAQVPASAAGPAPTVAAITPAPNASVAPGSTAPASAPVAAASAAAAPASGPIDANGVVAFRANAETWVQVTDAHGRNVYRKLMAPGETGSASGDLPLSVTVGSAASTQVQVRGQPYDLAPVTRGHVARFQVK